MSSKVGLHLKTMMSNAVEGTAVGAHHVSNSGDKKNRKTSPGRKDLLPLPSSGTQHTPFICSTIITASPFSTLYTLSRVLYFPRFSNDGNAIFSLL